ncbi:Protein of uncharacterised function (DUF1602) [Bordetella pertussis]|nr:Protein of uncharacterised function (DUF1602) [Bordetella pertussis]CPO65244.1 Protein of uncharacterised function (DUF1602) [Bordetella pertussis]
MVMPSRASSFMTCSTSPTSSGSSADVGSSNSITRGCIASARAIATRCFWPPDSEPGMAAIFSRSPTLASRSPPSSSACARLMPRSVRGPTVTLSSTERCGNRLKPWNTMPTCMRRRLSSASGSSRPSLSRLWPQISMVPPCATSRPLQQRKSVLLPEPLGPITTTTCEASTLKSMPRSTSCSP